MARYVVYEITSGDILGTIVTNRSLTIDEALETMGFKHKHWEQGQAEGWSDDDGNTVYDTLDLDMEVEN